jgi:uncharacterized membrane protein
MSVVTTSRPVERGVTTGASKAGAHRIASIDIVRGAVMVLMAIDHVRVFSGVPAGGPLPGVFFTRWITHFVAPAFIFLAGAAAFLHGRRLRDRHQLARFLLTRGAWLLLLELTFIRIAWTFNFDFANYLLAGVIWVIGWCMILMAALVYLPTPAIAALGLVIVFGHNLMDVIPAVGNAAQQSAAPWLWQLLYYGGPIQLGESGPTFMVLYSIVPWIGVMAVGYAFGSIMLQPPARRRSICISLATAAIALFLLLRSVDVYGEGRKWRQTPTPAVNANAPQNASAAPRPVMPAPLRFLNTSKYPASLLFLLMTLGPAILAIGLLEGVRERGVASVLATFGRVPLFYYLLHIPAIHLAAIVVSIIREGAVNGWLFANHPMMNPPPPDGYMWSLGLLYLVTAVVVTMLYFPCRWFARLRTERRDSTWLSYF